MIWYGVVFAVGYLAVFILLGIEKKSYLSRKQGVIGISASVLMIAVSTQNALHATTSTEQTTMFGLIGIAWYALSIILPNVHRKAMARLKDNRTKN